MFRGRAQDFLGSGLACGDLDGDGKPEIIAAGRATKNVVIYWNRNKKD